MARAIYTARDVLDQLDDNARQEAAFFPDFDHGYNYHVDGRLSVYGDASRWAIVVEQLAVNPRAGYFAGISTNLYFHGNCIQLPPQPGWENVDVLTLSHVVDGPSGPLLEDEFSDFINRHAVDITIRHTVVPIRIDPNYYWARKIDVHSTTHTEVDKFIEDKRKYLSPERALLNEQWAEEHMRPRVGMFELRTWHLCRGLVPELRELLLSADEERRRGLPPDLPSLLLIDEWDHPRLMDGELPSGCESFKRIAKVLASGDPTLYQPSAPPNTHWSNWPMSGSL